MKKQRHLDATGKGEVLYDYKYDILTFKVKDRKYSQSFEFQNFVADIDSEGYITGVRVFDASKVLGVTKLALKHIANWRFDGTIENDVITIRLRFASKVRNKLKEKFTQQLIQAAPVSMENASVECIAA